MVALWYGKILNLKQENKVMYGLNYDSNFDPIKPALNWKKVYNGLIIIGNVLFALWMIRLFVQWVFHV